MDRNTPILLDTVAILEAHEARIWNALCGYYRLETVETCVIETQTGYQLRRPELRIEELALRGQLHAIHQVTDEQLALVIEKGGIGLDDGEQALWAHALQRDDAWILCGPDKASMIFGYNNRKRDRLVSLGQLAAHIGQNNPLRSHFTKQWLDNLLTDRALGIL